MHEAYEMGLEEILAEDQDSADFENVYDWREEIDMAIAGEQEDLYRIHADAYLKEIDKAWEPFRPKPEIPDLPDPEADRREIQDAINDEWESGNSGMSDYSAVPRNRVP
jgi:hypothetical protein